MMETEKFGKG